jgi:hypothetical protein
MLYPQITETGLLQRFSPLKPLLNIGTRVKPTRRAPLVKVFRRRHVA